MTTFNLTQRFQLILFRIKAEISMIGFRPKAVYFEIATFTSENISRMFEDYEVPIDKRTSLLITLLLNEKYI